MSLVGQRVHAPAGWSGQAHGCDHDLMMMHTLFGLFAALHDALQGMKTRLERKGAPAFGMLVEVLAEGR